MPGARTVIEAQVREWCEQILVEVVLAARNSRWSEEQLDALLSPTSFTAALLPRHLLHATLQKRLAQKLGTPQNTISSTTARKWAVDEFGDHNGARGGLVSAILDALLNELIDGDDRALARLADKLAPLLVDRIGPQTSGEGWLRGADQIAS